MQDDAGPMLCRGRHFFRHQFGPVLVSGYEYDLLKTDIVIVASSSNCIIKKMKKHVNSKNYLRISVIYGLLAFAQQPRSLLGDFSPALVAYITENKGSDDKQIYIANIRVIRTGSQSIRILPNIGYG